MTTQKRRKARKKDRLLRVPEAADWLGYQVSTMRSLIHQQRIAVVRLNARTVRIAESEIERLIERGSVPARDAA